KAVDRSDPGYNEGASTGRECGRCECATYSGRFAAIGRRSFTNCGARRAIPRRTAEIGGTLKIGESCRKASREVMGGSGASWRETERSDGDAAWRASFYALTTGRPTSLGMSRFARAAVQGHLGSIPPVYIHRLHAFGAELLIRFWHESLPICAQ